jgi:hypothetical protein
MSFAIALQMVYRYINVGVNRVEFFRNILGRIDERKVRVGMYDPRQQRGQ